MDEGEQAYFTLVTLNNIMKRYNKSQNVSMDSDTAIKFLFLLALDGEDGGLEV